MFLAMYLVSEYQLSEITSDKPVPHNPDDARGQGSKSGISLPSYSPWFAVISLENVPSPF